MSSNHFVISSNKIHGKVTTFHPERLSNFKFIESKKCLVGRSLEAVLNTKRVKTS